MMLVEAETRKVVEGNCFIDYNFCSCTSRPVPLNAVATDGPAIHVGVIECNRKVADVMPAHQKPIDWNLVGADRLNPVQGAIIDQRAPHHLELEAAITTAVSPSVWRKVNYFGTGLPQLSIVDEAPGYHPVFGDP
jgi:hypothetical protein